MITSFIHFQHFFFNSIFFLIHFPTYCYIFSNFSLPFYLFIPPLLSILISLFIYLFIFFYFLSFLFPSSYYKFTILFPILYIVFSHTKGYLSLSLSLSLIFSPLWRIFLFHFNFSCICTDFLFYFNLSCISTLSSPSQVLSLSPQ